MKKFFVTLVILILLAALAFFFGWAQLEVPPDSYGVIRSKTHGVDPRPIRAGEFRWIWYKLIPTNVDIAVFRLEPVNHPIAAASTLPSGDTYAAFAGNSADFSWEISASLSFSINPDSLIPLVVDNNIGNQEALTNYEKKLAGHIEALIIRRLNSGEVNAGQLEELLKNGSSAVFERDILEQFPMIINVSCLVQTARFPDFALYAHVRGLYEDFIFRQREYMSSSLGQKAENRIDRQLRFEELEQYGALLTKYPILVEYLNIESKNRKTE
jgi:hypothetical protein